MAENITNKQFNRIHLFISEGQLDEALAALRQIQPGKQEESHEIAYLRAWCSAESNRWDEAARFLLTAGVSEQALCDIQAQGQTERRRKAYYQVLMGDIAANLGHYEEGMRHYRRCLKSLDERRMNISTLRIRALQAMGALSVIMGFYDAALVHYEDALRLCSKEETHPNLPDIYYGLCDIYRHKGNFSPALEYAQKALQLYSDRKQQDMVGRMRTLLGRVCYQMRDFQEASTYYTEALELAMGSGSTIMILNNLVALADLRREEGELSEAWHYCEMALNYSSKLPPGTGHCMGMMYIVCGRVKQAKAEAAEGERAPEFFKRAISFYEQAVQSLKETDARVALREAYQRLAQVLETCGQQDRAIAFWKSAYSTSSSSENFSFGA